MLCVNGITFNMGLAHSPNIIADGLVLYLDAANLRSYSGSGNTTYSLCGLASTSSLVNGVGFTSSNNGSFFFDGTNDYITIPHSPSINPSDNFSVQFWFMPKSAAVKTFITKYTGGTQGWLFSFNTNTITFDGRNLTADGYKQIASSVTMSLNNWYHVVGIKSGTNMYLYQNSVLAGSLTWTTAGDMATNNNIALSNYGGDYLQCNISQFQLYNRVLTQQEILQNYNATRKRFGL